MLDLEGMGEVPGPTRLIPVPPHPDLGADELELPMLYSRGSGHRILAWVLCAQVSLGTTISMSWMLALLGPVDDCWKGPQNGPPRAAPSIAKD